MTKMTIPEYTAELMRINPSMSAEQAAQMAETLLPTLNAPVPAHVRRYVDAFMAWKAETFGPGYYTDDNCLVAEEGDSSNVATLWSTGQNKVLVLFNNRDFEIVPAPAIVVQSLPHKSPPKLKAKDRRPLDRAGQKLSRAIQQAWVNKQ